jgi:hypothetical protein
MPALLRKIYQHLLSNDLEFTWERNFQPYFGRQKRPKPFSHNLGRKRTTSVGKREHYTDIPGTPGMIKLNLVGKRLWCEVIASNNYCQLPTVLVGLLTTTCEPFHLPFLMSMDQLKTPFSIRQISDFTSPIQVNV